jgi:hypothetical protein
MGDDVQPTADTLIFSSKLLLPILSDYYFEYLLREIRLGNDFIVSPK